MLNEIKMNTEETNLNIRIDNFDTFNCCRSNRTGGGVSLLINKNLKYEPIEIQKIETCEILGVQLNIKKEKIALFACYNPPESKKNKELSKDMLNFIHKKHEKYFIIGDLNSKHVQFGCKENNKNGNILKAFINDTEAVIINDPNQYTYKLTNSDYTEILGTVKIHKF
jgi:hypothetical protein